MNAFDLTGTTPSTHKSPEGFQTFGSSTLADQTTSLRIYINQVEVESFKELVFRGVNNWPDAPPALKQLYDILTHGKVLQDYTVQDSSRKSPKN